MKSIFLDTEFAEVHAKSVGNQTDPLVLGIHGFSQRNGWQTWEPLMQPLADAGFWVVSVDMPGWGQSILRKRERLLNGNAVTAVSQIFDALEVETAVLMGKSWGGGVALNLALQEPSRVSKLILTAPAWQNGTEALHALTQPVLMAWSMDDTVIPYSYAQAYSAAIPNCQLESYKTGGHNAAPNNAADFAPKAIKFLKREQ